MFRLKNYQDRAVQDFETFLDNMTMIPSQAYPYDPAFYMMRKEKYIDKLNVPFVCIKIPTGGGKTVVACHIVNSIYSKYLISKNDKGLVLWLVPTGVIKTQTLDALKDPNHNYRQVIDSKFSNNVKVFDFEEILQLSKHDLDNNLCILVTTVASFRTKNKELRNAWKNNGSLLQHFKKKDPTVKLLLNDKKEYNHLINVIRLSKPLIVIDEGHNVKTNLSLDMFKTMNPSFVVEYTATPRKDRALPSNVLVDVKGDELKAEHMVKLPINLTNITKWEQTIREGVKVRKQLAKDASKLKSEYIRPIALIQAQQEVPHAKKVHVDQVKDFLIRSCKIKPKEIAIKTGRNPELDKYKNLYSRKCPINYIITVKALAEGWDNAFAYVLISVANLGAKIAVEQIVGRVLRLPKAKAKNIPSLNESYVLTSSTNFSKAVKQVKKGLEENGFSADFVTTTKKITLKNPKSYNPKRRVVPKLKIPYITLKKKKEKLSYYEDLIEAKKFHLDKQRVSTNFSKVNQNRIQKIDVKNGVIQTTSAQYMINPKFVGVVFKKDNLISVLDKRIRKGAYDQDEKQKYILKTVDSLIKNTKYKLKDLAPNYIILQNQIEEKILEVELNKSLKTWKYLIKSKSLSLKQEFHNFPKTMNLENILPDKLKRHLYEKAGNLNKEERDLAINIDNIKNVRWWYRNRERQDFFIQGWKPHRFWPDFIIETKKGKIIVVEYKGGHLMNPDTEYKKELGTKWANLAGKNYEFHLVVKDEIPNFLKELDKK